MILIKELLNWFWESMKTQNFIRIYHKWVNPLYKLSFKERSHGIFVNECQQFRPLMSKNIYLEKQSCVLVWLELHSHGVVWLVQTFLLIKTIFTNWNLGWSWQNTDIWTTSKADIIRFVKRCEVSLFYYCDYPWCGFLLLSSMKIWSASLQQVRNQLEQNVFPTFPKSLDEWVNCQNKKHSFTICRWPCTCVVQSR